MRILSIHAKETPFSVHWSSSRVTNLIKEPWFEVVFEDCPSSPVLGCTGVILSILRWYYFKVKYAGGISTPWSATSILEIFMHSRLPVEILIQGILGLICKLDIVQKMHEQGGMSQRHTQGVYGGSAPFPWISKIYGYQCVFSPGGCWPPPPRKNVCPSSHTLWSGCNLRRIKYIRSTLKWKKFTKQD